MKEIYMKKLNEDIEVPEIVNQKCSEAYDKILSESVNNPHRKHFNKKYVILAATAAALAVGVAVPVMAEYIPVFKNAYEAFTSNIYTKSPQRKNNLTEYADNVGLYHEGEFADISIDNVYFDGDDISFSYVLSATDSELKKSTGITANAVIYLGDNENNLMDSNDVIAFSLADDGNYYGTYSRHVSDLKITDTTKLYIKFYGLEGRDYYTQVLTDSRNPGAYEPIVTRQTNEIYEFQLNVTPDNSNKKNYPVNETKNGITLESIDVSPFRTTINIKGISDNDNRSMRVKDNNGNEYDAVLDTGEMLLWDGSGWEAPLKDAESIIVEIFRTDADGFPTETSFTVPIEKGFREKYDVEYGSEKEITYIPPIDDAAVQAAEDEFEEQVDAVRASALENARIIEVNEEYYSNSLGINISVAGCEIVDDFSGYELTDVGEAELDVIKENHDEELSLCLIDYEISNPTDEAKSFYFSGNYLVDENLKDAQLSVEPAYLSVKDHGGNDSYIYDIEANETRHIVVGFIISREMSDNITYILPDPSLTDSTDFNSIYFNAGNDDEKLKEYTDGYILMKVK